MNLTPAVIVTFSASPAQFIASRGRIKALMPRLQASLPSSVKVQISHRSHDDDRARSPTYSSS